MSGLPLFWRGNEGEANRKQLSLHFNNDQWQLKDFLIRLQ
jgi:hypothetical protein